MNETRQLPPTVTCILLAGFMGAGKSTVGPLLAARLNWDFADADTHIERESRSTIAELFAAHGEAGFRRVEQDVVRNLIARRGIVLALGGGALESASTREAIQNHPQVCMIYLEAPSDVLLARCELFPSEAASSEGHNPVRPLFEQMRNDRSLLERKLASRLPHYQQSHLTVATHGMTPTQVSDHIFALVSSSVPEWAPGNLVLTASETTPH